MANDCLLLTNHGNEPYLLGIRIALACGFNKICVPLYYLGKSGESNQKKIITEEFPDDLNRIFLSKPLGDLLRPLIRGSENNLSYPDYVTRFYSSKNISASPCIQEIEHLLKSLLITGIPGQSINNQELVLFSTNNIQSILNIGLPIDSFTLPTFYIFTALMSAVYKYSDIPNNQKEVGKFSALADYWETLEQKFAAIYVPKINALSHLSHFSEKITYCPPLTKIVNQEVNLLSKESVLFSPSATGVDKKGLRKVRNFVSSFYQPVSYSPLLKSFQHVTPDVFLDNKLLAVISRGGWGTTWKCLVYSKPIGFLRTEFVEDPEIAHSIETISKLNIGFPISESIVNKAFPSHLELANFKQNIKHLIDLDKDEFIYLNGNYARNGIDLVAKKIIQYLSV